MGGGSSKRVRRTARAAQKANLRDGVDRPLLVSSTRVRTTVGTSSCTTSSGALLVRSSGASAAAGCCGWRLNGALRPEMRTVGVRWGYGQCAVACRLAADWRSRQSGELQKRRYRGRGVHCTAQGWMALGGLYIRWEST